VLSSNVTLLSFDQTLALMGGYAGTVWLVIGFFIGGF
jgi:heme exporter protein D